MALSLGISPDLLAIRNHREFLAIQHVHDDA
jgi:hypothetical protein